MSKNRENVIWQSRDRKWNRGFFDFVVTGPDDEWDVEYDNNKFHWVATDLPTEDAAREAWTGANPGGSRRVLWNEQNRSAIERYEKMATAAKKSKRGTSSRSGKSGAQLDREIRSTIAKSKKPYSW